MYVYVGRSQYYTKKDTRIRIYADIYDKYIVVGSTGARGTGAPVDDESALPSKGRHVGKIFISSR